MKLCIFIASNKEIKTNTSLQQLKYIHNGYIRSTCEKPKTNQPKNQQPNIFVCVCWFCGFWLGLYLKVGNRVQT